MNEEPLREQVAYRHERAIALIPKQVRIRYRGFLSLLQFFVFLSLSRFVSPFQFLFISLIFHR